MRKTVGELGLIQGVVNTSGVRGGQIISGELVAENIKGM